MTCLRTRQMLDAWLDGELDAGTSVALAQHAAGCAECGALRNTREDLRGALRAAPRHAAPLSLRRAVGAGFEAARRPVPQRFVPQWLVPQWLVSRAPRMLAWWQALLLAGATGALAVLGTAFVLVGPGREEAATSLREQMVARHVAALASNHLIDVASSDRHVVKPWFQGKVDFAPQVRDLSAQGFALEGARLDQVGGRTAVAVVYRIREHPINLFVWRRADGRADGRDAALDLAIVRGFSVAAWSAGGLDYAAVSDADAGELRRFAGELQALR